jgi:hypothetical protein
MFATNPIRMGVSDSIRVENQRSTNVEFHLSQSLFRWVLPAIWMHDQFQIQMVVLHSVCKL